MTFGAPAWLALLLLAGPILLLHMRSARRVSVPSLLLWRDALGEQRPRPALRRPPPSWALLLQLLALTLTALVLARPALPPASQIDHLVLLVDGGWQAADEARHAETLSLLRSELRRLKGNEAGRWTVLLVAEKPRPLAVGWPDGRADVGDLAARLVPAGTQADWQLALNMTRGLLEEGESSRVVLIGADAAAAAAVSEWRPDGAQVAQFPLPTVSTAVLLDAQVEAGEQPGDWLVHGSVLQAGVEANAAVLAAQVAVEFEPANAETAGSGGGLRGELEVPLVAGSGRFQAALKLPGDGVLTLRPATGPAPAATFVLTAALPVVPVLYVGPGNPPLLRALAATGAAHVETLAVPEGQLANFPAAAAEYGLVILDSVTVDAAPLTSTLWLGAAGVTGSQGTAAEVPAEAVRWATDAALVARTEWSTLTIASAWPMPLEPGAVELVGGALQPPGAASGALFPLVQSRWLPHGLDVRVAFDVQGSDWPDRNGFPVFIRELLKLIEPALGTQVADACTVGRACQLPAGAAAVMTPAGSLLQLTRLAHGADVVMVPDFVPLSAGLHQVRMPSGSSRLLAVNAAGTAQFVGVDSNAAGDPATGAGPNGGTPDAGAAPGLASDAAAGLAPGANWLSLRRALLLLLAVTLVLEAWLHERSGARASGGWGRRWVLRGVTVALVLVAVVGPRAPLPARGGHTAVVVPGAPWGTGDADGWGPTATAHNAASESPGVEVVSLGAAVEPTDLEAALDLAAATAPPGVPTQLVLIGDGTYLAGDYAHAVARATAFSATAFSAADSSATASRATFAASADPTDPADPTGPAHPIDPTGLPTLYTLHALPLARSPEAEVLVREVIPPPVVLAGDRFALRVVAHAQREGPATLRTSRDGAVIDERAVNLLPGINHLEVLVTESEPGGALYRAELSAPGDVYEANNVAEANVQVLPAGRVLLVARDGDWGSLFSAALAGQQVRPTVVPPEGFPTDLDALLDYDAVALLNLPAAALSGAQLELLAEATAEHGRALLLLGGEDAFGPGGYYETPLEQLSPVSSLAPRQAPELAVAFVIDRSNSMRQYAGSEVRLDIAKAAVLGAFDILPEGARATLIAFDSVARTLVPLVGAAEGEAFREAVHSLEPRGGTSIYPGLQEAHVQLADSGAAASHVVVMSDGLSQPGDFPGILAQLREAGVTVSTIGIGPEADAGQLREIAQLGGGSFHFSADFASLPGIMAHEVLLQTGELTEERSTLPAWRERGAPFLRAWPDELPEVAGFVPTTAKPEATVHLAVITREGNEVPLLASWRYGAGTVVAFTAHGAGPWSEEWLAAPDFPRMWGHLVRQLARPVTTGAETGQPAYAMGSLNLPATTNGAGTAGSGRSYPAELDFSLADPQRLAAAATATGGAVLDSLTDLPPLRRWYWASAALWPWLSLLALALLLAELAGRYAPNLATNPARKTSADPRKDEPW